MAGVNKVILIGNLGRDPDVKSFQNGNRICNLSIATSEGWRDKTTGEKRERTEWHRVVIFNEALVGVAEKYLKKGSKVYIEGQIETRKFERDGREQYTTEIVLRPYRGELTLLDTPSNRPPDGRPEDYDYRGTGSQPSQSGTRPDLDDEIPF